MTTPSDAEWYSPSKPKLVVFAPYPPAKNGIADYVAELMPFHLAAFDVTLVIADDAPFPSEAGPRVLLASEFERHRAYFASALKLYHIGNNPHHCYMLDILARDPGIVVLHDFNLCYLHEMATLRWGSERRQYAAMEREYGALGRDILSSQQQNGYRELFAGYELPLNGGVLENATAVITHSRHVQYKVAARVPHKPVWYVPHHLSPRVADYFMLTKKWARSQLGLPQNEIIVTAMGFVTRAKQIPMALAALSSLRDQVGPFRFMLAGERRPDEYDVDADIANSGLTGLVTCTDYLDEERFFRHLVASDIVVNLRYPSGGEMSGTLVRALGLGVPTIVLDHGPMGELPDAVVRKVAWEGETQSLLTQALHELMTDAPVRLELGARAADYIRREHDIAAISGKYNRILRTQAMNVRTEPAPLRFHFQHPVTTARKVRKMGERGRIAVQEADGRMWWAIQGIPLGCDDGRSALVVSEAHLRTSALLSEIFEWKPAAIVAMTPEEFLNAHVRAPDGTPLPFERFSCAVVVVPARMDESLAALLMRRLNAAICCGGNVCIETWATQAVGDSLSEPLLGQAQLEQRLRDAGFGTTREWSAQDGLIPELVSDRSDGESLGQIACVTARKVSDYSVWRVADTSLGIPQRWGGRAGVGDMY